MMIKEHIPFPEQLSMLALENGFHSKSKPNTCAKGNFRKYLQTANIKSGGKKQILRIHKYS